MISEKTTYFLFFLVGTAVPLYFMLQFISLYGFDLVMFVKFLFINPAASTFSSDLLIVSFAFWTFMFFDNKNQTKTPHPIIFIMINLCIGLSSALPLYLYYRTKGVKN